MGEKSSGVNYLAQLLDKNLRDVVIEINYGFANLFNEDLGKQNDVLFIIIHRNFIYHEKI